ncbi:hypothetical protein F52700_7631 [Fusarium sp. NRRL 52700]|nr:hypothetical protein F52700_7631 [Fusarium sp. NRRL 52700]
MDDLYILHKNMARNFSLTAPFFCLDRGPCLHCPNSSLKDDPETLDTLWDATRNFSEKTSTYKVKHLWNIVFEPFCQEVLERETPACSVEQGDVEALPRQPPKQTCPAGFS